MSIIQTFTISVNGQQRTIWDLYRKFDSQEQYLVPSTNTDITTTDTKKILSVTRKTYRGDLILIKTQTGLCFECTPDQIMPVLRLTASGPTMTTVAAQDLQTGDSLYLVSDTDINVVQITALYRDEFVGSVFSLTLDIPETTDTGHYVVHDTTGIVIHT